MIIGTVRILPTPGRHDAVIEVLRSVQGPVRAQPGCVACDVFDEQFLTTVGVQISQKIISPLERADGKAAVTFDPRTSAGSVFQDRFCHGPRSRV